jgi:O-acetyl-ADP-ribose deacetylase (regulator of RNase III)
MPPLGCGNGGLDWVDVYPRIEEAFSAIPGVQVFAYSPTGSPKPKEMPVGTSKPKMTVARALYLKLIEQYSEPGYTLSRLEIQKLAYFLQEAGQQLKLKFVKLHYGPYAENLNHALQRIEGHYIEGYGDRDSESTIGLRPNAAQKVDKYLSVHTGSSEKLERVSKLIEGFEDPYGLELLSTVHWVAEYDDPPARTEEEAIGHVCSWNARKKRIFKPEHIRIAWQRLRKQGWIDPKLI